MSTFNENFAMMLRSARLKNGLSQSQAAEALKLERTTYAYFEEGKLMPEIEMLAGLKKLLGVPSKAFLYPDRYIRKKVLRQWKKKKGT